MPATNPADYATYSVNLWHNHLGYSADLADGKGIPHPTEYEFLTGSTCEEIDEKVAGAFPGYRVEDLGGSRDRLGLVDGQNCVEWDMNTTMLAPDNCLILQGGCSHSPLEYQMGMRINPSDIIGSTYGQLVVDEYLGCIQKTGTRGNGKTRTLHIHRYKCVCACGGSVEVDRVNLLTNHTRSCGCLKQRRGKASPSWEGYEEISGRFWTHIQHHAASRGIPFDLTIEQAWDQFKTQEGRCALTGWPISAKKHKVGGQYTTRTASLDRIDSSKGYSTDNIQWLHKRVNKSKMEFGQSEFISMCRAVAKRYSDEQ